jgi:hypothetical protein
MQDLNDLSDIIVDRLIIDACDDDTSRDDYDEPLTPGTDADIEGTAPLSDSLIVHNLCV